MPHYFAKFVHRDSAIFRYDTRIYLNDVDCCTSRDFPIGAVVGKNPGSSKPSNPAFAELQPIQLNGGKLLPTVRSIVRKAYAKCNCTWPQGGYVQVLNLFYLSDPNFRAALRQVLVVRNLRHDETAESRKFAWILYLWGKRHRKAEPFYVRLQQLDAQNHFYYDHSQNRLEEKAPDQSAFAKHCQGMKQEVVIQYLAQLIQAQPLNARRCER